MAVKDKQAKQKFGLGWILPFIVGLVVLSILGNFIGVFPTSVAGLIVTIFLFIFLHRKVKLKTATDNERNIYFAAAVLSVFLAMDVLVFGVLYYSGYWPVQQLLNVSFPTAQQASSIFNTRLVTPSAPSTFGNIGTGQYSVIADAVVNYQLASNPSSNFPFVTMSISQFNNSTDAEMFYNNTILFNDTVYAIHNGTKSILSASNSIIGDYNGLTYKVYNEYATAHMGDYVIQITTYHSLNQTNTANFLKKEADIINGNS